MKWTNLLVVALGLVLAGCGITVKNASNLNLSLPADFSERTFVKDTASIRYELVDHVGSVFLKKKGTNKLVETKFHIRPERFVPQEIPIKDGDVYSSIITRDASLKGGYLAFAASLSGKEAQEVVIMDVMRTTIPTEKIPQIELDRFGTAEAERRWIQDNANPGDEFYWAKSLFVSRIVKKNGVAREASGDATTPVFGANGKVYEQGTAASTDWAIGAGLRKIFTVKAATEQAPGVVGGAPQLKLLNPVIRGPALKEDETELHGDAEVTWVKSAAR